MKKISSLLLLLSLVFSLFSCGIRMPEEEILLSCKETFKTVEVLNRVYYGSGIPCEPGEETYRPALSAWVEETGIHTVEELKEKTKGVFSEELYRHAEENILSPFKNDEGTVVKTARYYDTIPTGNSSPVIMVKGDYEPLIRGDNVYDLSTLALKEVGRNRVAVTVTVKSVLGEQVEVHPSEEMVFVWEDGKFKLDSFPCINFSEEA